MAQWIQSGNQILNVDQIEYAERVDDKTLVIHTTAGKTIKFTDNIATNIWNFLQNDRVQFLDSENPERDFSGT